MQKIEEGGDLAPPIAPSPGVTSGFWGKSPEAAVPEPAAPMAMPAAAPITGALGQAMNSQYGEAMADPAPVQAPAAAPGQTQLQAQSQGSPAASGLTLTQLLPANPERGWSTEYYPVYQDTGIVGAAVPGNLTTQKVRLIDPSTGATLAEGVGNDGAQQIATLGNAVSKEMGGKAGYQIQVEFEPGTFTTVGGDGPAEKRTNILKTLVNIAAPLLGAAIPGLGPILGAALGGFGGNLATGGNLKSALLSALTSGLGNSLGGAAGNLFSGAPVSFAGTNPLGSLLGNLTSGGGSAGGLGALFSDPGGAFGAAAGDAAAGTVSPLIVTAGGGGLGSALTGGLGTALGGLVGAGGAGGSPITGSVTNPGGEEPVSPTDGNPKVPDRNLGGDVLNDFFSRGNLLDLLGQTVGGVGADLGVYGLAQLLGFGGGGAGGAVNGNGLSAPGYDGSADPSTPGGGLAPAVPPVLGSSVGAGLPGSSFGSTGPVGGSGSGGGALGQALSLATGGGGGSTAPLAAAPSLNVRGSTAPDIYPWRSQSEPELRGAM